MYIFLPFSSYNDVLLKNLFFLPFLRIPVSFETLARGSSCDLAYKIWSQETRISLGW